jgi:hypothetical protein
MRRTPKGLQRVVKVENAVHRRTQGDSVFLTAFWTCTLACGHRKDYRKIGRSGPPDSAKCSEGCIGAA